MTHVSDSELLESIRRGRVIVAQSQGTLAGWLRWHLFWDETPFMNMLFVLPEHRERGISRRLIERWEADCTTGGHDFVLTSTLSNEDAQHLNRHLGYVGTGCLDLPGEPREIILRHELAV